MMSSKQIPEDRGSTHPATFRHTPLQIIHIIGNFMRIWSIYSMYHYLSQTGASVVLFIFSCLVPSSIVFLTLQKPWKGRPLSNTQVVPSIINGGITALYFILWGKGLKSCGPVRAIMAEYSGAVLGVLSAVLYGRRGHVWKKVGGLIAMLASLYFLSQGWAMATYSPFSLIDGPDIEVQTEQVLGMKDMAIPIFAGILSALRRVIARRVSLKGYMKQLLWNVLGKILCRSQIYQMGFWGTKYKCLHFQLESFFGFIYIASNCIWQLSSKLLQKCWLCLITCTTYQGRPKQILDYWNHRGNSQAGY